MNLEELKDTLEETLGRPRWAGSDSTVWIMGGHVVKATRTRVEWWRSMRLLSRRSGPFAPILDMRVAGIENGQIVGLIVQPYIRMDRELDLTGRDSWHQPHDTNYRGIPVEWFDGIDAWIQRDDGTANAVGGLWVDPVRIEPLFTLWRRHYDGWLLEKLGIRPRGVSEEGVTEADP